MLYPFSRLLLSISILFTHIWMKVVKVAICSHSTRWERLCTTQLLNLPQPCTPLHLSSAPVFFSLLPSATWPVALLPRLSLLQSKLSLTMKNQTT